MNELQNPNDNPFQQRGTLPDHVNAGTVMIEQERAIAEVKGKLSVAKMFPRNEAAAYQRVLDACSRIGLAEIATYAFPRGGKSVSGPSIRLAEVIASAWGNIEYGLKELSRKPGTSEMEAYAWDLESNTVKSQRFTVNHIRDKTEGGANVTSERDIYELTANQGARRMREAIFAVIPPDLIDAALKRCKKTLAGNAEIPIADRVRGMIERFNKLGVTEPMLRERHGADLSTVTPEALAEFSDIFNSIRDAQSTVSDWFGKREQTGEIAKPAGDMPATKVSADSLNATQENLKAALDSKTETAAQKKAREKKEREAAETKERDVAAAAEAAAREPVPEEQATEQEQPKAALSKPQLGDVF